MLDNNLRLFYAEIKSKKGEDYSSSHFWAGIRMGLQPVLNGPPYNRGITLAANPNFQRSNAVLNAKIKSLKKQGKQAVKHKPALNVKDLAKLHCLGPHNSVLVSTRPRRPKSFDERKFRVR